MIDAARVSAVLVTRGDVDLAPILATLPYEDVVIWDNSEREWDAKPYGRYLAMDEARNEVIYFQDDDVVFTAHDELLAAYKPGRITANMPSPWYERTGYDVQRNAQVGAGALVPKGLSWPAFDRYLAEWPMDDLFLTYCDQIHGILTPSARFDFGYEILPYATAPGRINTSPGAFPRKMTAISRALAIRDRAGMAA